ncbi:MAG: HEAT repeat domain-containing protein [Planctomycetes bacterium]|nr:HEAT repeat domain-containing protein [Planctomycetota bacterium]
MIRNNLKKLRFIWLLQIVMLCDLDVIFPPGTPDEIAAVFYPNIEIKEPGKIKTGTPKPQKRQTQTEIQPGKVPVNRRFPKITLNPRSGFDENIAIPTSDYLEHLAWIRDARLDSDLIVSNLGYQNNESSYAKADASLDCFIKLLLKYLHTNKTLDYEDIIYLSLIGDPAATHSLTILRSVLAYNFKIKQGNMHMADFISKALTYINPDETAVSLSQRENKYDQMIYNLVLCELASNYPFAETVPFAANLDNFTQEEIYPYILEMLDHPSKRIKRNAVYYLGTMHTTETADKLFEIYKNTSDNTERLRALFFLTQMNYKDLSAHLVKTLAAERDPVLVIAIINSLRKIGDKKAFPELVKKLVNAPEDYELYFALIKACVTCIDLNDKNNLEAMGKKVQNLYTLAAVQFKDPEIAAPFQQKVDPDKIAVDYRRTAMGQILEIAISAINNGRYFGELTGKITRLSQKLKPGRYRPNQLYHSNALALSEFQEGVRAFFIEALPRLKNGDKILSRLLLSGFEHDTILVTALQTYYRHYKDDFPRLAHSIIESALPSILIDRTIRYMYLEGINTDKTNSILHKIVSQYTPEASKNRRHIIAIALYYYTTQQNNFSEEQLIKIAKNEVQTVGNFRYDPQLEHLHYMHIKIAQESYLAEAAIILL